MALIEKLHFDNGSLKIFNVSHAVGARAANWCALGGMITYTSG